MLSKNFYYRLRYQLRKKANFKILYAFLLDRLKHPLNKTKKKYLKNKHKNFLVSKKTTSDYFSLNAYYWDLIINKNFNTFSYLEIGSWEGNSALYILENFKTKKVVCVDIWDLYEDSYKNENFKRFENFQSNLLSYKDRYSFFKNTSDIFFQDNNEKFDIIYIDGWHEAPQVYKDICNSWNCLNKDGIIICDDYFYGDIKSNLNINLPADSINRFIQENENKVKVLNVNNTQVFIKKLK
tara:strand:- start:87 stop:803 length:717 start_codon:yes stop_codon:yes gene_type:complete